MIGSTITHPGVCRKLATTIYGVMQMKTWKMKMPQRKTDYQKLKQAAEAIGGGD